MRALVGVHGFGVGEVAREIVIDPDAFRPRDLAPERDGLAYPVGGPGLREGREGVGEFAATS